MTVPVPAPNKRPPIAHRADGVVAEVNNGSEPVRSGRHRLGHLKHVYNREESVDLLTTFESARIQLAIEGSTAALLEARISLRVRRNFETYAAIRRTHGDILLNQAFDPRETRFGQDDFWLLAANYK